MFKEQLREGSGNGAAIPKQVATQAFHWSPEQESDQRLSLESGNKKASNEEKWFVLLLFSFIGVRSAYLERTFLISILFKYYHVSMIPVMLQR